MANIKTLINKIRTAVYGLDVREAIASAIEQTYVDANSENTNIEVVNARGEYETLGERLDNFKASNNTTLNTIDSSIVSISLNNATFYECLNDIEELSLNADTSVIDVNFRSCVVFETGDITEKKATQGNIIFTGEHCAAGELTLVKNTLYVLEISYLKTNWLVAKVFCYAEGDTGSSTDPGEETPTPTTLHDFYGADEIIDVIAMSYHRVRTTYMTYGNTNIMTDEGAKSWSKVTISGADSPDSRYRKLDCSAFVSLCMRGIVFAEVFQNETTYNNKDLSARTTTYDWAIELPRTAAEQCKFCEDQGWTVTDGTKKKGDLIFFKGTVDNGRYKQVNHACIYYGPNSNGDECVIEFTSSSGVKKHSDGITCGVQIIQFSKKDASRIVTVARPQTGSPKAA